MNIMDVDDEKYRDEFSLSFSGRLGGPVRCVAVANDDTFVAGTTEGCVSLFKRCAANSFETSLVMNGERLHGLNPGLLLSMKKLKNGAFISGGSDGKALVWTLSDTKLTRLNGHNGSVNSVVEAINGDIVTGSFDGSAIVWRKNKILHTLKGHEFGVEVLALPTGEIVTASGNRERGMLRIWKGAELIKTISSAHAHIIRKLALHPFGFASCANDGYIKIWSNIGEELMSTLAHPENENTASFVYSISTLASGEIVSVGEDAFARIIAQDGSILHSIRHPSPIRDVAALPGGDFVTACTDGVARVWTRSSERRANESDIAAYEEILELAHKSKMQGIDASQIADKSVLKKPGTKPGQVVIVDIHSKGPTVFQWDAQQNYWQEIGAAIGQAKKQTLDGKEYDHVVDVVVREGAPVHQLGFNKSDDPVKVARAFCVRHNLGADAVPQVTEFLTPLADPIARLREEEKSSRVTRAVYTSIPCWRYEQLVVFDNLALKPLRNKLQDINTTLVAAKNVFSFNDDDFIAIDSLLKILDDISSYTDSSCCTDTMFSCVQKIIQWPLENSLPVLDFFRMLMLHSACAQLVNDKKFLAQLLQHSVNGTDTHQVLVLRALMNWTAKRSSNLNDSLITVETILRTLSPCAESDSDVVSTAFVMLCHNIVSCVGRFRMHADDALALMAKSLLKYLQKKHKNKPTYFALTTLGTIMFVNSDLKEELHISSKSLLSSTVALYKTASHPGLQAAARELNTVFNEP